MTELEQVYYDCYRLWKVMYDKHCNKCQAMKIINKWFGMYECPCCIYVIDELNIVPEKTVCNKFCPMIDLWGRITGGGCPCEKSSSSPYRKYIRSIPESENNPNAKKVIYEYAYMMWRKELNKRQGGWNLSKYWKGE